MQEERTSDWSCHEGTGSAAVGLAEKNRALVEKMIRWTREAALPLWSSAGFDPAAGGFHEQLTFDREPVVNIPRRAMVQSRQISVYAQAWLLGWSPNGKDLALQTAETLLRRYARDGGSTGFVFSIDIRNGFADERDDLYAQAFVLFAFAWILRLDPTHRCRRVVDLLLTFLDSNCADPIHGGYWDADPRPDGYRRQNPHMHLFEALLELYDATGEDVFLHRLNGLRDLCEYSFCTGKTSVVHELYSDNWTLAAPLVEPGHLMEWSWLLARHDKYRGTMDGLSERLFDFAYRFGLDTSVGRLVDEVSSSGDVTKASSRSWPHTEAVKAIVTQFERGRSERGTCLYPILDRLRTVYLPEKLRGGWIDQVDSQDRPTSAIMPASTFYHVFLAVAEASRLVQSQGWPDARTNDSARNLASDRPVARQ